MWHEIKSNEASVQKEPMGLAVNSQLPWGCRIQALDGRGAIKDYPCKPGIGQNIALPASPTARKCTLLRPLIPAHLTSFLLTLFRKKKEEKYINVFHEHRVGF